MGQGTEDTLHITMHKTDIMRTYCLAQGTQLTALCWPKWKGHPKKGGCMYSYSWVSRNWRTIVKQLYSLHKKSPRTQHMKHGGCVRNCIILVFKRGGGNGIPRQYSRLENPLDGGAWWAAVYRVAKGQTRLSDFTFTFHFHALEKEMATHSSVLAWRIPGTAEPGGLPSMRSHRVGHDWSDLAAAVFKRDSQVVQW